MVKATIANGKSEGEDFTKEFTITVTEAESEVYSVTVLGSASSESGEGSYEAGETVTIKAGSRSSYRFAGWVTEDVVLDDPNRATTTFTMPEKEVTVQAKWIYVPGTGGGDVKPPIVVDPVEPSEPDVSFVDVKVGDWYEEAVEYERTIGRHALPLRGQPGGVSGWSSCFRLGGGRHGLGNRLGDHQRHGRLLKAPVRRHPRPAGRHAHALHRLILYAPVGAAL